MARRVVGFVFWGVVAVALALALGWGALVWLDALSEALTRP